MEIKGYKVFKSNWTCRDFQYEVGKIYEMEDLPSVCHKGFHFCKKLNDCFNYYSFDSNNKIAEVTALGQISQYDNKYCTNKIRIDKELSWEEALELVNIGNQNTGRSNIGKYNEGSFNIGDNNTGISNIGNYNSGTSNIGDCNSRSLNIGNHNSGTSNIGDYNSGMFNIGSYNIGHFNRGTFNKGSNNLGNCNEGDFNIGDWNLISHNKGCFCTKPQKLRFFDKDSNITLSEWANSEAYWVLLNLKNQNDIEPQQWWNQLKEKWKESIKNIPNFDAKKFKLITGIDVTDAK